MGSDRFIFVMVILEENLNCLPIPYCIFLLEFMRGDRKSVWLAKLVKHRYRYQRKIDISLISFHPIQSQSVEGFCYLFDICIFILRPCYIVTISLTLIKNYENVFISLCSMFLQVSNGRDF